MNSTCGGDHYSMGHILIWTLVAGSMDTLPRAILIKKGADPPLLLIFAGFCRRSDRIRFLEREATQQVMFAGILYYDGQGFPVPSKENVHEIFQLNGASIYVIKGTMHEGNLADYFRARRRPTSQSRES